MPEFSRQPSPLSTLLTRLSVKETAAPAYEQLHLRLTTFFRRRFPVEAEALADEAIDRLARRLSEGIPVDNIAGYALGIARFMAMEVEARRRKETHAAREAQRELESHAPEAAAGEAAAVDASVDPALPALKTCLESLEPESARLILEYYALDGGASRIELRQRLAESAGLTLNALRNRALRTRMALEKCVRARLGADRATAAAGAVRAGTPGDVSSKINTSPVNSSDDAHD